MKKIILHSLKALLILISGFPGLVIVFVFFALVCSIIPVNKNFSETNESDNSIYLLSNGVHLDIVMPKVNDHKDWREELQIDPFIESRVNLVAFGWGDREFYLNTPEWSDLTFRTAFNALFLKDSSAMHVSYFRDLTENKRCIKLNIPEEQYIILVDLIEGSFSHDSGGMTLRIQDAGYNQFDQFYEAQRSYHLFYTCNTWTNRVLKNSGLRACLWTPFDRGILWQYQNFKQQD